jgi:hypothetical protein
LRVKSLLQKKEKNLALGQGKVAQGIQEIECVLNKGSEGRIPKARNFRAAEMLLRRAKITAVKQKTSEIVMGFDIRGIKCHDFRERGESGIEITRRIASDRQIEMGGAGSGAKAKRLLVLRNSQMEAAVLKVTVSRLFVGDKSIVFGLAGENGKDARKQEERGYDRSYEFCGHAYNIVAGKENGHESA